MSGFLRIMCTVRKLTSLLMKGQASTVGACHILYLSQCSNCVYGQLLHACLFGNQYSVCKCVC